MTGSSKIGTLAAMLLIMTGAGAAGIAWWYNYAHTNRAVHFWGPQVVDLIREAPEVKVFRLAGGPPGARQADRADLVLAPPIDGTPADVLAVRDISQAKGLIHLRHALLDDRSFAWRSEPEQFPELGYALVFARGGSRITLYFSEDLSWCFAAYGKDRLVVSTRPIAKGLRKYFADVSDW